MKDLSEGMRCNGVGREREGGYVRVWGGKGMVCGVYLNMGDYGKGLCVGEDIMKNCGGGLWSGEE